MAKPVILTVDDDPDVLQATSRDLRHHYGEKYRIVRADSGESALNTIEKLKLRNESVALLLADQRMPQMNGVDFLEKALKIFPEAKRVLLTAYADTNAAIQAINTVRIDYYLLKPWDPPEERLYPVLDDLLDDWQANFRLPFQGIRVIGNRWSSQTHDIKDFLARNQIPYRWLDVGNSQEAQKLIDLAQCDPSSLPLVFFEDEPNLLQQPSIAQIAERMGLRTKAEKPFYDLAICGAGPAGLAAAVYGASEGLRTVLIEREAPGGQAGTSSRIENYLGFPVGLSGGDLTRRAVAQATRFGVEILNPQEVTKIEIADPYRVITLSDGSQISCHALILALGVSWRRLDVPGLDRLTGAGVYYGAAQTEAMTCQDEQVYIVGGANSAGQAAMYFSRYASKVTMLVRSSLTKSMSQYLINQIAQTPNITVQENSTVIKAEGSQSLEAIFIQDIQTGEIKTVAAKSLFIFIGAEPRTQWLEGIIDKDDHGYILTGKDLKLNNSYKHRDPYLLETSVPGIFAVGDVRHGSVKRVASGVGEGSICVQFVHQYLAHIGS